MTVSQSEFKKGTGCKTNTALNSHKNVKNKNKSTALTLSQNNSFTIYYICKTKFICKIICRYNKIQKKNITGKCSKMLLLVTVYL